MQCLGPPTSNLRAAVRRIFSPGLLRDKMGWVRTFRPIVLNPLSNCQSLNPVGNPTPDDMDDMDPDLLAKNAEKRQEDLERFACEGHFVDIHSLRLGDVVDPSPCSFLPDDWARSGRKPVYDACYRDHIKYDPKEVRGRWIHLPANNVSISRKTMNL